MELDINGVHGVEITLSMAGNSYNDLPVINWHKVPEASGCNGWLARRVTTVEELEVVLHEVQTRDDGAYIEVKIPKSEMVPLPDDALLAFGQAGQMTGLDFRTDVAALASALRRRRRWSALRPSGPERPERRQPMYSRGPRSPREKQPPA